MDIGTAIRRARATRDFADRPIDEEAVRELVDAARNAGSGHNRQPWTFIAVSDRDRLGALAACGTYTTPLTRAPLGIVLVVDENESRLKFEHNVFDCGRAAQNLVLAATTRGLGIVPQAISEKAAAAEILDIPDGKYVLIGFAVGYPASEPDETIEGVAKEEELDSVGRKPVDEVLDWERYAGT